MMAIRMRHYVTETKDGLYHVQNVVMGYFGQHHVHTKKQFEAWLKKNKIAEDDIIKLAGNECDCGLKAGEVKDGLPDP
jgi:hypothetical protein